MFHRFNLTALLTVLAVLDLLLDRVFSRLFLAERASASASARWLSQLGNHVSNLCGALALLLFASTFIGLIRRRELFPRAVRVVTILLGAFFVLLLAACVASMQAPGRLFVLLTITHAFVVWLTALAVWSSSASLRAMLGVSLFALPAILHTAALFTNQVGRGASAAGSLARIGELCAFIAAGAAPLLLLPRDRGGRWLLPAWLLGLGAATLVLAGLVFRFDTVQVLALYALRLDLPALTSPAGWAYALLLGLAVLGTFLLVIPALAARGSDRLLGYGVVLVVVAGYQAGAPADMGVSACGMLAIALGVTRRQASHLAPAPR